MFKNSKHTFFTLILILGMECLSSQMIRLNQTFHWITENELFYQTIEKTEQSSMTTDLESWFRQEKNLTKFTPSPVTTLLTPSTKNNSHSLLIAYPISEHTLTTLTASNQYFENQNHYIQTLFNLTNQSENQIYQAIDFEIYSSQNLLVQPNEDIVKLLDSQKSGTLHLRLYPNKNQVLFLYLGNDYPFISVEINDEKVPSCDLIQYSIQPQEEVIDLVLTFHLSEKDKKFNLPEFKVLNSTLITTLQSHLNDSPFDTLSLQVNQLEGTLHSNESTYLLINIPYHSNWHAFLHSKEVPIYKLDTNSMAIPIEKGTEDFTLIYYPRYLQIGTSLSLITLGYHLIRKLFKKKGTSYEKQTL